MTGAGEPKLSLLCWVRMDVGSFPVFPSEGGKMISGAAKVWKVGLDASHENWPGRKHPCWAPYLSEPIRSSMFSAQFSSSLLGCCPCLLALCGVEVLFGGGLLQRLEVAWSSMELALCVTMVTALVPWQVLNSQRVSAS